MKVSSFNRSILKGQAQRFSANFHHPAPSSCESPVKSTNASSLLLIGNLETNRNGGDEDSLLFCQRRKKVFTFNLHKQATLYIVYNVVS
jgi:hypothetical protein